jgi:putative transposase
MKKLKHNKHSIGQSAYHMVWKPKYNCKVFRHSYPNTVCEQAILSVAERHGIEVYELKVMEDHIHLFAEVPTTMSLSKAFQLLKGGSSRIFFMECWIWKEVYTRRGRDAHLWSPGKFYRSVGNVTAEVIEEYISHSNKWDFDFLNSRQTKLV